ncbi:MAG TPA: hypothetical protein VK084_04325, partial [Chitinophagaceae bacterium]|nr:hypothetical protein [Chitinophagaceae bacterium]
MEKRFLLLMIFIGWCSTLMAQHSFRSDGPRFSTAGFFKLPDNDSRQVFNFNNGWLYHKGEEKGAEKSKYIDSLWKQVSLPHGVDIRPENVSGGANYQGVVWYRKHFFIPKDISNKKWTLTFGAIMGKCKIYLNGSLIKQHKGGYLP